MQAYSRMHLHILVPNIMPALKKNCMAFLEPKITRMLGGGGDLHAGMRANVDRIMTVSRMKVFLHQF